MELSDEDKLRLNVLLVQELQALRIDESRMQVLALTERGEAVVTLNPSGRDEQYLRKVRELISTQVMDSPGGYPVYLERWTRYAQEREEESLQKLLLLGEPEAVVAVVHAPGLTPELARRAWWAMPEAENARCLLSQPTVANAPVAQQLAQYLIEYLPFETEPAAILNSVRLVLQPGLADQATREKLWRLAQRKGAYYIGFLQAIPDQLPEPPPPHADWEMLKQHLRVQLDAGNPFAEILCRVLSPAGQAFLNTVDAAMGKLADQAASVALFEVIGRYFAPARTGIEYQASCEQACLQAAAVMESCAGYPALAEVLALIPAQREKLQACLSLAQVGEHLLDSFFSRSDTVGSLMRRKLLPWTAPVQQQMQNLRG